MIWKARRLSEHAGDRITHRATDALDKIAKGLPILLLPVCDDVRELIFKGVMRCLLTGLAADRCAHEQLCDGDDTSNFSCYVRVCTNLVSSCQSSCLLFTLLYMKAAASKTRATAT